MVSRASSSILTVRLMWTGDSRLLENAPVYFDVKSFPDGETKRALQRILNKRAGKTRQMEKNGDNPKKKRKVAA